MPYSNDERDQLEFYKEFVDDLRSDYINKVKRFFPTFRDSDGVLYSYEDILTGFGLEEADVKDPLHSFLYEVDWSMYTMAERMAAKNDPDITLVPDIRDRRFNQYTLHSGKLKRYIKTANEEITSELYRIALKLATGTGKTTVMAMIMAWQKRK